MTRSRRRVLMFDMDGTLADTMPDLIAGLIASFRDTSRGGLSHGQIMDLLYLDPKQMMQAFVELSGWPLMQVQSTIATLTAALPPHLFPEVPGVLDSLKRAGYVVAVTTNTPQDVLRGRIAAAGISDLCDVILGMDVEAGITKEDHPRVVAERLGLSAANLASVGAYIADLPVDMRLARKVGMLAIGRAKATYRAALLEAGADYVIDSLLELEPLLTRLS